jgi:putative spermidine/putrescine transport system permease protein
MFSSTREGLALALPAAIFALLLFILPVGILLSEAFQSDDGWTLKGYIDFFSKPLNQKVFLRTLKLGVLVAGTAAIIGYAAAFSITNLSPKARGRVFGLVILPLMISPVARTYAWIVILGRTGIVNDTIVGLGLSDTPIRLLFTETAVFLDHFAALGDGKYPP